MKSKKLHLSLLIFFQLGAVGTYVPIISIYLKDFLGYSSIQTGLIMSLAALPSILSPFISAWIVDRVITSRRLLILCTAVNAALIVFLSFERSYLAVLVTYFLYTLFLVPTFSLVHALIFHNIDDDSSFGFVRSWGTVGWILTGWLISYIWKFGESDTFISIISKTSETSPIRPFLLMLGDSGQNRPLALQLSALLSIVVIVLTLKLPKLELNKGKKVSIIPHEALSVIKKPEVLLILLLVLLSSTVDKFISYGMPIFLNDIGVNQDSILILLSYGQIPEVLLLFVLAGIVKKFGLRNIFILAFALQILRFAIFYFNGPFSLTVIGSLFHGCVYPLFYAPATIYIDRFTTGESRAGVHQIYNLIFAGAAGLLGNLIAGVVAENFKLGDSIDFKTFWMVPLLISVIALFILLTNIKRMKITNS